MKFQCLGSIEGAADVRIVEAGPLRGPLALYGRDGRLGAGVGLSAAAAVMGLRSDIAAGSALDEVAARFA